LEADAYRISPVVYVAWLVPPLVAPNVPARVIAPVDDVLGVNPDRLVWNDVTPPVEAAQEAVVPLDVSTYPLVPIASRVALLVPFPIIKSPVVVIGDNALNAEDALVWPVPP
jgi:hypothetical protein